MLVASSEAASPDNPAAEWQCSVAAPAHNGRDTGPMERRCCYVSSEAAEAGLDTGH